MHIHFFTVLSASALLALSHAAPTPGGPSSVHNVSPKYGPDSKCFHYYFDHLDEYKPKYGCQDYEQYKCSYADAYYVKKKAEQDKKEAECKKQDYDFKKHTWHYTSVKNSFEEEKKKYNALLKQYNLETTRYEEHKKNYEAFKRAREEENRKNEETKKYCEKVFEEVKEYFKPKQSYHIDGHQNSHGGGNLKGDGKGFAGKKDEDGEKEGGHGGVKNVGGKDGGKGRAKDGKDGKLDDKDEHDGKDGHDGKASKIHGKKDEKCHDEKKDFSSGGNPKSGW
ncbi:hypothetical protein MVLG_00385 [Microbotryum lychnidis-dioicae p1A1 Lamole]|uniref:Uncharacterized protein n=1 Tax=Microbotryum lychnidis-dioicae (strain p1A1 Lamole / MvSl-1064) TaxID=683840 RepID=U5GYX5_USTV1|nr:hypothetical protein MVLG_00385 [Microbotryum lychnidis-dioicae p1A1 Lamole]|eukprot:KDE09484.1 hypothetical protein MVLG_00385 [Microbotryum lychnidis-dioicae p1A1 Lamole]